MCQDTSISMYMLSFNCMVCTYNFKIFMGIPQLNRKTYQSYISPIPSEIPFLMTLFKHKITGNKN